MRRVFSLAVAGAFALLFSASAEAQVITFTASLSGGNEVPVVAATAAGGVATVTLDTVADTVSWVVDVFNLPSGATQGHSHVGAHEVSGPVVINFTVPAGISNDFRITGTARASDLVLRQPQGIGSWEDFEQAMVLEQAYVNIHSQVNPGGEVRGQLRRVTGF
jgi:CHRD domain